MSKNNSQKRKLKKKKRDAKARKDGARRIRKMLPVVAPHIRECGECHACCVVMEVEELDKPLWTPCEHICVEGCAVYEDRPPVCRDWYCFWRIDGHGVVVKEHERPDKIGVFAEVCQDEGTERVVVVRESWPGGSNSQAAKDLINRFARTGITAIFRFAEELPRICGPEKEVRKFQKDGKFVMKTPEGEEVIWASRKEDDDAA
jgi:hypothetical protein